MRIVSAICGERHTAASPMLVLPRPSRDPPVKKCVIPRGGQHAARSRRRRASAHLITVGVVRLRTPDSEGPPGLSSLHSRDFRDMNQVCT
jgi:hypothetical protein